MHFDVGRIAGDLAQRYVDALSGSSHKDIASASRLTRMGVGHLEPGEDQQVAVAGHDDAERPHVLVGRLGQAVVAAHASADMMRPLIAPTPANCRCGRRRGWRASRLGTVPYVAVLIQRQDSEWRRPLPNVPDLFDSTLPVSPFRWAYAPNAERRANCRRRQPNGGQPP